MPQIVWIARPDGTLDFINDCWTEYTGAAGADAAAWAAAVHPDDLAQLVETAAAGRGTGQQHRLQYRVRRAPDHEYRWHRARVTPLRDEHGAIVRWFGIATDVHDQLEASRALVAANEEMERRVAERTDALERERTFLAAVLDSLHDGIVACDRDANVTVTNRAMREMLNLPAASLRPMGGSDFYTVYREDGVTPVPSEDLPLVQALSGEEVHAASLVLAPAYARARAVMTNGRPILGPDEEPLGAVIAVRDVTAQREAEAQLAAARDRATAVERARADFVSRMSHELRTPLDAIVGLSDVLRRDAASRLTAIQAQLLGRLGVNARHLVALVENLVDLCDVEAGRLTMLLAPTRVEQVVSDVVDACRAAAEARGLRLETSVSCVLQPVTTDATRLRQVLLNLVTNAVKFTERGVVTVAIVADPATGVPAAVEVRDTGVGISNERRRAIFATADAPNDASGDPSDELPANAAGDGVGLAFTRSLCEALRYGLSLSSEVGVGSTFTVTFPADEARATHRAA
jgi:PAS domain S-box-containing protein